MSHEKTQKKNYYFKNYIGSPTPLIKLDNLSRHLGGAQIWAKVVSEANGGAHKIYNATVHALICKTMGKKYLDTKQNTLEAAVLQVWQVAAEEMDPVNPKAAAKKFKDRKDKDIDNDGDVDSSDKYLHKRRKAIGKAMKKEGLEDSPNPANSQHLCAKNVVHEEWGEGQPVHGMHAMPDVDGNIAWYDVMFEHGIEKGVSINELKVTASEMHHDHGGKKKLNAMAHGKKKNEGAMKRGKDMDTFKPKPQNEEVELEKHREFKVQSMRDAMEQVWARSVEDKLFEDIDRMSDAQFDEFVDSLNEEELDEILGRFTAAGQARRAIAKRDKAQQKLKDTKAAVDARRSTRMAKLRTKVVKRIEKRKNPGIIKRATSKIGDVATKAKDALMR